MLEASVAAEARMTKLTKVQAAKVPDAIRQSLLQSVNMHTVWDGRYTNLPTNMVYAPPLAARDPVLLECNRAPSAQSICLTRHVSRRTHRARLKVGSTGPSTNTWLNVGSTGPVDKHVLAERQ